MQNREVPLGSLPIFFSSRQRAEAGRSRPEVWGGEDRARNAGYRLRNAEDGGTGTGRRRRGCGATGTERRAAGAGAGRGTRKTRAWGAGRKTRNTWTRTRARATGARGAGRRTQNAEHGLLAAGSRTRETRARGAGDGAQAPVHGPQRDCIHPPGPATTCPGRSLPGAIRRREGAAPIPRYDAMFLYHLFWFSSPHPRASGVLVPFREVKGAAIFEPAFRKLAILPLSRGFSGRAAELAAACLALGGASLGKGDVGYRIPVFAGLDVAVLFWDGDEEFDASANILFDKNFTDFTHVETVVTVGVDAAESLLNLAGIPHESSYK